MLIDPFWLAPPLDMLANYMPHNPIAHYEPGPTAHMGPFEMQPFQLFDFTTSASHPPTGVQPNVDITPYSNSPWDWSQGMQPTYPNLGLYSHQNYTGTPTGPQQNVTWGMNVGPWQWDMGHYSEPYHPDMNQVHQANQNAINDYNQHNPSQLPGPPQY